MPIRSDPVTSIRHSPYEHYVLSGDGRDVVLYCWSSSSGWRSTTLRAVSSPAGEPSSEAPAVDGWPTALGVFAAASNADLLFYEKH